MKHVVLHAICIFEGCKKTKSLFSHQKFAMLIPVYTEGIENTCRELKRMIQPAISALVALVRVFLWVNSCKKSNPYHYQTELLLSKYSKTFSFHISSLIWSLRGIWFFSENVRGPFHPQTSSYLKATFRNPACTHVNASSCTHIYRHAHAYRYKILGA